MLVSPFMIETYAFLASPPTSFQKWDPHLLAYPTSGRESKGKAGLSTPNQWESFSDISLAVGIQQSNMEFMDYLITWC